MVRNIDISGPLTRETAGRVVAARNALKIEARAMMADKELAKQLNITDPVRSLEFYISKYSKQGFEADLLWQRIIRGSTTPNASVNSKLNIE